MAERSFIPMAAPALGEAELRNVTRAVQSGWISSAGEFVTELERCFAESVGVEHAIAVSSGTAALHLALAALGIGDEDEVIVPAITHISTLNAVTYQRATPVVVDCDAETWCLDAGRLEAAISERTRAIIAVHLYGNPCDMDAINAIAAGGEISVVEDAAEATGARCGERMAGSLGRVGAFSFYANKIMTTGEGGMVTTDDAQLADLARSLRDQAHGAQHRFIHDAIGFNYRMTNLQAAVGVAQLERLEGFVEHRRRVASLYRELLADIPGLIGPPERAGVTNVHWMYAMLVEPEFGISRDELMVGLRRNGIDSRPFFYPAHRQPIYADLVGAADCPVSDRLGEQGIILPTGNELELAEVEKIAQTIRELHASGA